MADRQKPYYILGLDPGIASCGFCLIDTANHEILEMGAHLFDTPQEPKTKTSLAVTRRNARSVRRNTKRTRDRQKHCMELLKQQGLMPNDADKTWFQTRKGDKPTLKLRKKGLDTLLSDREWAQVLYSLSGHRGYIPHGEVGKVVDDQDKSSPDADESRKVLSAIAGNAKEMDEKGYRTVGELLHSRGTSRNRGGDYSLCVANSQLVDEVEQLFSAQRSVGNTKASQEFQDSYLTCMKWEKKSLSHDEKVYGLVGPCSYFPEEKRAAQADLTSEMCRAYERLGHLVITDSSHNEQRLTPEQINGYMDILFSPEPIAKNKDCAVKYSTIRKDLGLSSRQSFKGIDTDKEKAEVFAPRCWRRMRKSLPTELMARMRQDRALADNIGEALTYASTEDSLKNQLTVVRQLNLNKDELESILALPYASKSFKGYGTRSLKALNVLVDVFEEPEVFTLTDAEQASGLEQMRLHGEHERSTLLPPFNTFDPTCRNPVVLRAMGRMRRIINAIDKRYGVPDEVHIELGRDLKHSTKEKKLIQKANRENKARNERYAKQASEIRGCDPNEIPGKVLRKYALWEEQGGRDAYTDAEITLEAMIRDDHYCEIDHILPYSRTCDDSRANKVLVLAKSNQDKKERSPYEWMTSGEPSAPDWDTFKATVEAKHYRFQKKNRLLEVDLANKVEGFIARNLNDTRYMSKAVKDYIEHCLDFPTEGGRKKHVSAVAGGATGNLRHTWGLNLGEGNHKDRSDDRHHAVDAAVIAACSDAHVKKVAELSSLRHKLTADERDVMLSDSQPWPSFAADVLSRREKIVPTRMADHGVTGAALEDTLYRFDGFSETGSKMASLYAKGRSSNEGNIKLNDDGSARIVGGMAFLRLWLDPDARANGKIKGRYYAEPVYFSDIPLIRNGSYTPKLIKTNTARSSWPTIPDAVLVGTPLTLHRGDVISIDGRLGRFWSIGISTQKWEVRDLLTGEPMTDFPRIAQLGRDTDIHIVQEDVLGHCYKGYDAYGKNEDAD